ncbi:cap-specific mRNA (nucleoside-2'-O-)-methyltransferase 2 [Ceratina calcarata]|uniref:Cap-specific mRNA (nucleoside-2'-O-)-methyltransferase 2 n=1 Tax=Ceratina calcarata TaxID=156304 RepID=A0AAJ7NGL2_9HYME|nr:cap-specific mRNA (nucleoside-2'-O-)-methyltransferase 2 [Ceratina calcarata]
MEAHEQTKKQNLTASNNYFDENEIEFERVTQLFNKRFTLVNNELYSLPKLNSIFKYPLWSVPELQELKKELNGVKNCLNNYDLDKWQLHTKLRNSAKNVIPRLKSNIQPELLTQAWCKFHEIVSSFPLIPLDYIWRNDNYFKSIHLCEAPGAFVTSLNHWLQTNVPDMHWDWTAMTLNPYYEGNSVSTMIDDDRFIRHTLDYWYFGEDNTGNIMTLNNFTGLIKHSVPHKDIFLVTADGSVDCADVPAEQESVLTHLHFCETLAALHLLAAGGSFLLKIFTMFECNTICLLYLLACCFTNVSITKPATSKEGNSEVYVVCTNFKRPVNITSYLEKLKEYYECDPKTAIFNESDIPRYFIEKIINCSNFFKTHQCSVIQNNIDTFNNYNYDAFLSMRQIQRSVADKYIKDYKIRKLGKDEEIIGNAIMSLKPANFNPCKVSMQGSYNERCEKQHLAYFDRMESFYKDIEKVEIYLSHNDIKKVSYLFEK